MRIPGGDGFYTVPLSWPSISPDELPSRVENILAKVPNTQIDSHGFLNLLDPKNEPLGSVPFAPTQWNIENSDRADRLYSHVPWGIVLHWFGDRDNFDGTVKSYLRGFDSLRQIDNYITRTSAHFLVGAGKPGINPEQGQEIFILQTQAPASDGTPFVASHLQPLNYQNHKEKKQYFVRALYQLGYDGIGVHNLLQDLYDGPKLDPNMRTIAIEIAGYDFENEEHYPTDQKIANVLSVVWSGMKRYGIPASNLMGHNEIQLGKADPGKKFMALIRYLIGIKALLENDGVMRRLVFGDFLEPDGKPENAVRKYFEFVRSYLLYVGARQRVFEWEAESKYWFVHDLFSNIAQAGPLASEFRWPFNGEISTPGYHFLKPGSHDGIDLYADIDRNLSPGNDSRAIDLIADGKCLFLGQGSGLCKGQVAIFLHRQVDGSEVASIYDHLEQIGNLQMGKTYPLGYRIGSIKSHRNHQDPFLHFSVAYGATWDMDLRI